MRSNTDTSMFLLPRYISYILLVFLLICTPSTIDCSKEQYRRCRELNRPPSSESIDESILLSTIPIVSPLQGFYNSTCDLCPNSYTVTDTISLSVNINKTRAVVFATSASPSFEKILIVTAGLLSSKSHVTIVTGPNMPDPTLIRQVLFQHVPCDQHLIASMLLDFKQLHIDSKQLPCPRMVADPATQSPGDILLCNIQNADILFNSFNSVLQRITKPSVLLMDAACIAGMLAAEKWKIPAVLIVDNPEVLLRHILGSPKIDFRNKIDIHNNTLDEWNNDGLIESLTDLFRYLNPRKLFQIITSSIQDRLNSMDLTSSFMALNRVRTRLKLHRIRLIPDMYQVGGSILLAHRHTTIIKHANPKRTLGSDSDIYHDNVIVQTIEGLSWTHILENLYTIPDPLLPPCIACISNPVTTRRDKNVPINKKTVSSGKLNENDSISLRNDNIPTIVLSVAFRNDERGRSGSRRLMLGFWLARKSVNKLSRKSCNINGTIANNTNCWNGPSDFQIVRPGTMPEVLPPGNDNINDQDDKIRSPSFITAEETTYLDTLSRHQPIAMVSVCDNSNTWTQSLGPPVLCLDTSWPARKIAIELVKVLKNLNSKMKIETNNNTNSKSTNSGKKFSNSLTTPNGQDGLEWIVSVVEMLSELREEKKDEWETSWQMGQDVSVKLKELSGNEGVEENRSNYYHETEESLFDILLVYLAWFIFISSIIYLPINNYAMTIRFLRNRRFAGFKGNNQKYNNSSNCFSVNSSIDENTSNIQNQQYRYQLHDGVNLTTIGQEIYFRLPDLDLAWNMFTSWIHETLKIWPGNSEQQKNTLSHDNSSLMNGSNGLRQTNSIDSKTDDVLGNNNTSNGGLRKRRSVKKRH